MTMFAGAFALDSRHPIPGGCCETIRRILSRDPSDEVQVFRDGRSFLAKLDIGAFGQPAVQVGPNGAVSMLTGEPLLALDDDGRRTRQDDLGLLHQEWLGGRWELLRKARGLFSAVHYDPVTPSLSLIADKLAIRPLYYWVGERHVVFSTAIRVLEELDLVPKVMDFRGVTEIAYVHYPLSRRTGYADIHTVRPSERVTVSEGGLERSVYWRWDEIEPFGGPETEMVQEGYRRFRSAVRCRIREDTSALALLSGGLDSRSVVGMLRDLDVDVHTYNFAPPRTQDRAFGREFARRVGTYHEEITLSSDWADTNAKVRQLAQAWAESPGRKERPPERPMLEWGGVGGSFGLGHIYLNQQLIDLLRAGDRDAVVRRWMGRGRVIRKLMQPEAFKIAGEVLRQGIREELDEVHCPDPARDYYLFIMFNDQRHLLYDYFENLDVYRLDVQMPFFDSEFLAWIMAIPIDLCLRHEYYMRWLGLFPRALTAVPWQAYPGHVPCPIPFDETLRGQWDEGRSSQTPDAQKRRLLGVAREILGEKAFPRPLLRKSFLWLATLAYRAGVRDYGYVIRAAAPYCRYWVAADGEYVLPPTAA